MTRRAHRELVAVARLVENLAGLYPDAIDHLRSLATSDEHDGYPTSVPGAGPPTSTPSARPKLDADVKLNVVEAAAAARLHHGHCADDLEAGMRLLTITVHDMLNACHAYLRNVRRHEPPKLCEPHGKTGWMLAHADGGWSDLSCRDAAAKSGLCAKHYQAWRRWCIAHDCWRGEPGEAA